jgi:hypothetical protein
MRAPIDVFSNRMHRVQDTARTTRAAVTQPRPPVLLEVGRTLPAWTLRAALLVLGAAAILLLWPGIVAVVILAALLILVVVVPGTSTGAVFCGVLGLFWMFSPSPAFSVDQIAVLAIGPLVWTIAGVITGLGLRTKVEWRVLRTPALRFLGIQVLCQVLLVGAQLLQSQGPALSAQLAGLIAFACTIAIAVGAWLILPTITGRPR